jgi:molecular chaperone HscC
MSPTQPETQPRTIVGIDLGTTYSLVAILQNGTPVVLPNAVGEILTPSAVSVDDDGKVWVGAPALARQSTYADQTATAFKRDMGTNRCYRLAGRDFSPQQLSALVLKSLKADAEAALGMSIEEAVITVPAYFDESQRRATRDAAELAGLRAERIVNEPTAAAMAYGLHERQREFTAVVLDLGGGTFDVTVMDVIEGVIEIRSSAGDTRLGGEDFVDTLVAHALRKLVVQPSDLPPNSVGRLRIACELCKRRLSSSDEARIVVPGMALCKGSPIDVDIPLSRTEAEALWAPLLGRLQGPILKAMRDAQQAPEGVHEVLLVGGSTRMPCVAALAAQIFGRLPSRHLPPDEAVAMGAAVQAALKARDATVEDMVVTDIAPFTMGIAVVSGSHSRNVHGIYLPVLERGTVIPASRVKTICTIQDQQKVLDIEVFQGEHSLCRDNKFLGTFRVQDLPPKPAGEVAVDVRFTYDINGLLEVEATVLETKQKKSILIEKSPGRMTEAQIVQARMAFEKLKFHPRDALPNATALSRAEACYVELTGWQREDLGQAMALFRSVLDSQEIALIEDMRGRLLQMIDQFSR